MGFFAAIGIDFQAIRNIAVNTGDWPVKQIVFCDQKTIHPIKPGLLCDFQGLVIELLLLDTDDKIRRLDIAFEATTFLLQMFYMRASSIRSQA